MLENKIPPPLVTLLCGVAMWCISLISPKLQVNPSVQWGGSSLLLLTGLLFSFAGVIAFRRARTTVNPLKPESASALVRSGVYRITRNPMYVGFAFVLLAWACILGSPWTLAGILMFILYMNRYQIGPEERALTSLFQNQYLEYQTKVRRWL